MNHPTIPPRPPTGGGGIAMLSRVGRRWACALVGDSREVSLNQRLFNSVSLLNAVTNIGGIPALLLLMDPAPLVALNLGTGLMFAAFYGRSRFGGPYRPLYWPFVLTILVFLFANMLLNAGSAGGAVWYLVPALVIATALAPSTRAALISGALFSGAGIGILLLERRWPEVIRPYASEGDRFADLAGNLAFAVLFTGGLVLLLVRTLDAERHRSDALLLNVLPQEIADELKRNSRVVPRHHDSVTVLFSDFVGFTQSSERLTPDEVIRLLDEAFQEFDEITQAHGLEKIKTIGDAYMAAGGIPRANTTHAIDGALAALGMLRATERRRLARTGAGIEGWNIRIGLNTGPLVAGVVGTEKFAYDVWGDTVNTASRMESAGIAGQINLSQATVRLVEQFFVCEPRGRVHAKGKGELEMFILRGLRPEFSDDGITPNSKFESLYRALAVNGESGPVPPA